MSGFLGDLGGSIRLLLTICIRGSAVGFTVQGPTGVTEQVLALRCLGFCFGVLVSTTAL